MRIFLLTVASVIVGWIVGWNMHKDSVKGCVALVADETDRGMQTGFIIVGIWCILILIYAVIRRNRRK